MQKSIIILCFSSVLVAAGCSLPSSWVYKIDVQQGNVITQDMVDKLKAGMDPQQVRAILGTPLLIDPFHPQRWDYLYSFAPGGGHREQRRITVVFDNEKLVRVQGDIRTRLAKP
jgi:outer membrane protein assembly factor BamE